MDFDDLNWETRTYSPISGYEQSKQANILFTKELDRRLKEAKIEGVTVYTLHPGVVATDAQRYLNQSYPKIVTYAYDKIAKCFFKTPLEGAQTTIYCAIDERAGKESGLYYVARKPTRPSSTAENMVNAHKLWNVSLQLVGLEDYDPFKK